MVSLEWVLGLLLLAPIVAIVSGAMVGASFSQEERRTAFPYGVLNMVFEWAASAAAAAAGLTTTWGWLVTSRGFVDALTDGLAFLAIGFGLLLVNGLIEAAGPMFFGIEGMPPWMRCEI